VVLHYCPPGTLSRSQVDWVRKWGPKVDIESHQGLSVVLQVDWVRKQGPEIRQTEGQCMCLKLVIWMDLETTDRPRVVAHVTPYDRTTTLYCRFTPHVHWLTTTWTLGCSPGRLSTEEFQRVFDMFLVRWFRKRIQPDGISQHWKKRNSTLDWCRVLYQTHTSPPPHSESIIYHGTGSLIFTPPPDTPFSHIFTNVELIVQVYYEETNREVQRILTYECRCNERLKVIDEGSVHLGYTGLCGGLDHLKIETGLRVL